MSEQDMDAPVTRREMHDALGLWRGAIMHDIVTQVVPDIITQVKALLQILKDELLTELRGQTRGNAQELEDRLAKSDEPYRDLPARVSRLEATVFGPSPKRNRRRAR